MILLINGEPLGSERVNSMSPLMQCDNYLLHLHLHANIFLDLPLNAWLFDWDQWCADALLFQRDKASSRDSNIPHDDQGVLLHWTGPSMWIIYELQRNLDASGCYHLCKYQHHLYSERHNNRCNFYWNKQGKFIITVQPEVRWTVRHSLIQLWPKMDTTEKSVILP